MNPEISDSSLLSDQKHAGSGELQPAVDITLADERLIDAQVDFEPPTKAEALTMDLSSWPEQSACLS
ncbi:hypothetical protein P0D88_42485 [Paraburkholderia sp. RL18-103-BIB-C]|jgi:hypothetical protein|uniref:hypothetical protein n=1 Tax=unclassified Paraburkholderia TaxID=2615204 RepID=UPI0038BA210D